MPETLDAEVVDSFQFAGQDIPWLVAHWAKHKPDHPFLIWEPRSGSEQRWSYSQFEAEITQIAAGLAARGVSMGDKILMHCD